MNQSLKQLEEFLKEKGFEEARIGLAIPKLLAYRDAALEWNNKVNLTSITNPDEFLKKHYMDSLLCAGSNELETANTVIDVGTGGGFPGIPLAIMYPGKKFVLLDSLQKRLKVVRQMADDIGLTNIEVVHGRAEDLARNPAYREQFDLCVSRAVANLSTLAELCLPFVKVGGAFISYKGSDCNEEVSQAQKAIHTLGGRLDRATRQELKDFDLDHAMLYIRKERKTPAPYPRKAGMPSKDPIK